LKKGKKIILVFCGVVLFLFLLAIVVAGLYENKVKSLVLAEINASLLSPVKVESIDFSLIKKFPDASLVFNKILIEDNTINYKKDTLLYADKLFLEFNLWSIFFKNYSVKQVDAKSLLLKLKVFKNGKDNFHIWKTNGTNPSSTDTSFDVEKFTANASRFIYVDEINTSKIDVLVSEIELEGAFSSNVFSLNAAFTLFVNTVSVNNKTYLTNKNITANVAMNINAIAEKYQLLSGTFNLEEIMFGLKGNLNRNNKTYYLDLSADAKDCDIDELTSVLSYGVQEKLSNYKTDGRANILLKLNGPLAQKETPLISLEFNISDGQFKERKTGVELYNLTASGVYRSDSRGIDGLQLNALKARFGDGEITAKGNIYNFSKPYIQGNFTGNINLAELKDFIGIEKVEKMNGRLKIVTEIKGQLQNFSALKQSDAKQLLASGKIEMENISFLLSSYNRELKNINGSFLLSNNDAAIENLVAEIESNKFVLTGFLRNFVSYLFVENEQLSIEANLQAGDIDLAQLLENQTEEITKSKDEYALVLPENLSMNLNLNVAKLDFRKFKANNIKGNFMLQNKTIRFDPVSFTTSNGSFLANLFITQSADNKFAMECVASANDVQIKQIFYEFENFGQSFINQDHIKGKADAKISFKCTLSDNFYFYPESIYSLIDLKIKNGELINHSSMKNIALYIQNNNLLSPFIKTDELKKNLSHIKFSELENQIEIKNRTIYLPSMSINTNAMNINISGTHSFDNNINYKVNFKLSQLLTKKQTGDEAFGDIVEDDGGSTFFLSMKGNTEKPDFGYDKQGAKENRKQEFKKEKETFKEIINNEFNIFKKNKKEISKPIENPEKTKSKIIIEWDDGKPAVTSEKKEEVKQQKKTLKEHIKNSEEFEEDNISDGEPN
jgi:AsmA-like C-terminal region